MSAGIETMKWTKFVAAVVIVCMMAGCTTFKAVSIDGSPLGAPIPLAEVTQGDRVRVTLNSGETREFVVVAIEADQIVGEGETHAFTDIRGVEVRRADETGNTTVIVVLVALVALMVLALDSLEDTFECIGGSC